MQWIWDAFVEWIRGFLGWLFDPVQTVDAVIAIVGWMFFGIGSYIGGDLGDAMQEFGQVLQSELFARLFNFGLWFMEPAVHPDLVKGCASAVLNVWVLALCLKTISWIWSKAWSGEA